MYCRHSIRLNGFDYSKSGYYFVTICTQNRDEIFGKIVGAGLVPAQNDEEMRMVLNDVGKMVDEIIFDYFYNKYFGLDIYQIMPNHIHLIMVIKNVLITKMATTRVAPTLGEIIGGLKSKTTNEYIKNVKLKNWEKFNKRLWQRNYYEHIIRNEKEYFKIKEYIRMNPKIWFRDRNKIV